MPICRCCGKDEKLTKEHIFPKGLLKRLEDLEFRPNQAWSIKTDEFYYHDNPVTNDFCDECQSRTQLLFDDHVDNFFTIIKAGLEHVPSILEANAKKIKMPSLSIDVEEPWFTLYLLRLLWNTLAIDKNNKDFQGAFEILKEYLLTDGDFKGLPGNIFLGLTYKPPVNYKEGKGIKSPLLGVYYADPKVLNDGTETTRCSIDVICYRLLIGEVHKKDSSKKIVRNYFRNVMKKHNGILLQANAPGKYTYTFEYIDPILKQPWGTSTDKLMESAG